MHYFHDDLGVQKSYGTDQLEFDHMRHTGQPRDEIQPAQVQEKQLLIDLISLYEQVTNLMDEGLAVDVSAQTSAKLSTPSPTAFLEKLAAHSLDRWDLC